VRKTAPDSAKKKVHHGKLGDRANKKNCHCEAAKRLWQSQKEADTVIYGRSPRRLAAPRDDTGKMKSPIFP
jgi:hypothetical protein